ncbi:c-type cytochrome [Mucilaginibacter myungsuensis]|uniref:C-type cytochrome n=1 Tax=Mucilaginibacter myungsuensis TaxID=649104 RepID=A0A929L5T4_9SPHI|nr:c-type cytochrome [Mucilaginibacter myungsuensis]
MSSALPNTTLGKALYVQHCQTCHQADGAGAQNMVPPLIR